VKRKGEKGGKKKKERSSYFTRKEGKEEGRGDARFYSFRSGLGEKGGGDRNHPPVEKRKEKAYPIRTMGEFTTFFSFCRKEERKKRAGHLFMLFSISKGGGGGEKER